MAPHTAEPITPAVADFWYRFGYEAAGPLLAGFTSWLTQSLLDTPPQLVCFLARDGLILQRAYERFRRAHPAAPPSCYLHASRRALNFPAVERVDDDALLFLTQARHALSVRHYLERVGIDARTQERAIARAGFANADERIGSAEQLERLKSLFRLLANDILERAHAERSLLLRYLQQMGVTASDHVAVVDIGWHGSLQRSLMDVLARARADIQMSGYYLATFPAARTRPRAGSTFRGYVCENGLPLSGYQAIRASVEIFEFIHLAPHGTVVHFREEGDRIVPVFAENDADAEKIGCADAVQSGALDFIDHALSRPSNAAAALPPSREAALAPLARILTTPTPLEARLLGDLNHADGFGGDFETWPIARPVDAVRWRPLALYEGYRKAYWRNGYLVRVFGSAKRARQITPFLSWIEERQQALDRLRAADYRGQLAGRVSAYAARLRPPRPIDALRLVKDMTYNAAVRLSPASVALMKRFIQRRDRGR